MLTVWPPLLLISKVNNDSSFLSKIKRGAFSPRSSFRGAAGSVSECSPALCQKWNKGRPLENNTPTPSSPHAQFFIGWHMWKVLWVGCNKLAPSSGNRQSCLSTPYCGRTLYHPGTSRCRLSYSSPLKFVTRFCSASERLPRAGVKRWRQAWPTVMTIVTIICTSKRRCACTLTACTECGP